MNIYEINGAIAPDGCVLKHEQSEKTVSLSITIRRITACAAATCKHSTVALLTYPHDLTPCDRSVDEGCK